MVSASSDFEVHVAITVGAVIVVIYTVVGGLLADVVTDFVQGIAVIIGLAVLLIVLGNAHGGVGELVAQIEPGRLALFSTANASPLEIVEEWAVPVCGSLLAVEMLARIMGCRTAETARNATLVGAGIYVTVGLIPVVIGLAGPKLAPGLEEPEQIVAVLAQQHLSLVLYVLFAGAVISAILSTVNSCLLAPASLVSHNLILPLKPGLSEHAKVWCARVGVIAFGALAYGIALYAEGIYQLVETASAFGSSGIFVVGMFGLFSNVGRARSAYAALIAGMVVWAAGEYWLGWPTPYIVSLAAALAAYLAAALVGARAPLPART
jgi:Na+/proline symporter